MSNQNASVDNMDFHENTDNVVLTAESIRKKHQSAYTSGEKLFSQASVSTASASNSRKSHNVGQIDHEFDEEVRFMTQLDSHEVFKIPKIVSSTDEV